MNLNELLNDNKFVDYVKNLSPQEAFRKGFMAQLAGLHTIPGFKAVTGPAIAGTAAVELGGALAEVRKLGAEKIAEEKLISKLTAQERLRIEKMLKESKSKLGARSESGD